MALTIDGSHKSCALCTMSNSLMASLTMNLQISLMGVGEGVVGVHEAGPTVNPLPMGRAIAIASH